MSRVGYKLQVEKRPYIDELATMGPKVRLKGKARQALVDELTRFAFYINDKWRDELVARRKRLGDNEFAFERCIVAYLYPTRTPREAIDELLDVISLKRLLELHEMGKNAGEVARRVAEAIPRFKFGILGWKKFQSFIEDVVKIASKGAGNLASAFKNVKGAGALEKAILHGELRMTGIGKAIARCLIRDLSLAGLVDADLSVLNASTTEPVMEVLKRTKLIPKGAKESEAEATLKKLFKVPPMVLDAGLWYIGHEYCMKDRHDICPLTHLCPKDCPTEAGI